MRELRPGVWKWQSPHPDWNDEQWWPELVSSYAVETGGELLLFDPLSVPSELLERATAVVLTAPYHERPIDELRRIYALHNRLFGRTPREQWLPLEGMLADEVRDRLARLGYDSLDAWAGVANLEERVDGENAIDPIVLEALREDAAN